MSFKNAHTPFFIALAVIFATLFSMNLYADEVAPAAAATSDLEALSSPEVVHLMGLGWNLGNTMECAGDWIKSAEVRSFETAWGNPETTKEMIDKIKEDGFQSIRIPVAWSNMLGNDYKISPALMARVKQIVDWALADGLIVVVNIHWDGGWWSKFPADYDNCMRRYTTMWSQIAENFKDYPGTLIFESLNEEGCFNDVWNRWGPAAPEKKLKAYGILNNINQAFVDLVRKSGGLNAKRHLLIAGYATDIDLTTDPDFLMPKDAVNHLILSVHYYTPYTFAGLEKDESWGKARSTWGEKADFDELDANVQKLKPRYLDQGIPIILGEYGATLKNKYPESVRLYMLAVAGRFYAAGMCPMLWDPGSHFNRKTLVFDDAELLKGFQKIMAKKWKESLQGLNPADRPKGPEGPAPSFTTIPSDILQQAKKNAASTAGAEYEKSFTTQVGNHLDSFLRVCTLDHPQTDDHSIVLKIEKTGAISGVYADRDDFLDNCLAGKLANETCPEPPSAPYFELINLAVNK